MNNNPLGEALARRKMNGPAETKQEHKKYDLAPEVEDVNRSPESSSEGFDPQELIRMMQEKGMNPEMLMKMMQQRSPAVDPMRSPAIEPAPGEEMDRSPAVNNMENFVSPEEAQALSQPDYKPKSLLERAQMAFSKKK